MMRRALLMLLGLGLAACGEDSVIFPPAESGELGGNGGESSGGDGGEVRVGAGGDGAAGGAGSGGGSGGDGSGGAPPAPLSLGVASFEDVAASSCGPSTTVPTTRCVRATISSCADVADLQALLKITEPSQAPIGTIVLGVGGGGGGAYEAAFGPSAVDEVILPLVSAGYRVIQRMWLPNVPGGAGWLTGPGGPRKLACRYATLVQGVHDQIHSGGGLCVSGNSGGASEISYALAHYGSGQVIDRAVITAGPPHGRIDYGCLGAAVPGWPAACDGLSECGPSCDYGATAAFIDASYGTSDCEDQSTAMSTTWLNDSVLSPDAVLSYPETEVRFVHGEDDCSSAVPLGRVFAQAIESSVSETVVPATPHAVPSTTAGAQQVFADLAGCQPVP